MTESISVIKPWLYDLKACYHWITLKSTSDAYIRSLFVRLLNITTTVPNQQNKIFM